MSLSCLMCQPTGRSDSDFEHSPSANCRCCVGLCRSLSGGLTPPPYYTQLQRSGTLTRNERRNAHRKTNRRTTVEVLSIPKMKRKAAAAGTMKAIAKLERDGEPRLMRSGGMRRDWSFEDFKAAEC